MATKVTKKDGSEAEFEPEKVMASISAAAKETDLSEDMQTQIVEEVSSKVLELADGKETITTEELKKAILKEMDVREPRVAEAWRKYDSEHGKS